MQAGPSTQNLWPWPLCKQVQRRVQSCTWDALHGSWRISPAHLIPFNQHLVLPRQRAVLLPKGYLQQAGANLDVEVWTGSAEERVVGWQEGSAWDTNAPTGPGSPGNLAQEEEHLGGVGCTADPKHSSDSMVALVVRLAGTPLPVAVAEQEVQQVRTACGSTGENSLWFNR